MSNTNYDVDIVNKMHDDIDIDSDKLYITCTTSLWSRCRRYCTQNDNIEIVTDILHYIYDLEIDDIVHRFTIPIRFFTL